MTQLNEWPEALAARPVCPHRKLPIPFIAEIGPDGRGEFTVFDHAKTMACLAGRLCAMCGGQMEAEVALIGDVVSLEPDGYFIEPPVHERCGELAVGGLCPFLSGQRVPRRPPPADAALVAVTAADLRCVGRGTAKRPVIMAVAEDYQPGQVPSNTGSPVVAYRALGVLRVRRYAWAAGRLAEVQPEPPRPPVTWVRRQSRRLPRSKR